jgi:FAD/FMN-containing dehydrogenase/Fe-S oxidoreductase
MKRSPNTGPGRADPTLIARLRRELEGDVLDGAFSRSRYSTDASFYRIEPLATALPRTEQDVTRAVAIAREGGVPVLPRGGGTSLAGQTVGEALVIDTSKYLRRVIEVDAEEGSAVVEPGLVLDQLNARLAPHGLFFPVDPATSSRATLGGMAGNNSSGARSIRYGQMVDNVHSIDAVLSDGESLRFERWVGDPAGRGSGSARQRSLLECLLALRHREADEIERRVPKLPRHVAGYNLHRVSERGFNMADLLVGSEGTLAFFTRLHLKLEPLPAHRVLGVCEFDTFRAAMEATPALVELGPSAVELMDRTLLELGRSRPMFRELIGRFVSGDPEAILLVEFEGDDEPALRRDLRRLEDRMGELGHPGSFLAAPEPGLQRDIWTVRKSGLNIAMSMKGDGKPIAFVEDCTVPLEHLADYTAQMMELFDRHGTRGVWYAHASVGCLHVRPILNLRSDSDLRKVRAIAEQAHELVRRFGGTHSGEHGDGLVRSEFLEPMLGPRLVRAFEEVKQSFDPEGLFNPGKIVRPPRMDDPSLLRFRRDDRPLDLISALDWSEWGGLLQATEMCNNNGACRKADPGVMCPSYRATFDEQHVTRGRANALRDALLGRLGPDALSSPAMHETFDLCVGCKACRRECPTGVDVARMKIEVLHQERRRHAPSLRDRLVAYLPRYAPWASRFATLANLPARLSFAPRFAETLLGLSARRSLPRWRRDSFVPPPERAPKNTGPEVVLLVDTFNTYLEPENARAAMAVLEAAGCRIAFPRALDGSRPLCCGRTFLSAGLVEEARLEARRMIEALDPWASRGVPIVGLEPSCLLTLRDEFPALLPGEGASRLAERAVLLEEYLAAEPGELKGRLGPLPVPRVLVHGHCHQKAFDTMDSVVGALRLIPELRVDTIDSSCCGMAGSFGYEAEHYVLSMKMAELDLLPAVREADVDTWLVADGTSCRAQIRDGAGRESRHVARVLEAALRRRVEA